MGSQDRNEKQLIDILKTKIAEKVNSPEPNSWQQRDFENLSVLIEEKTKLLLSISTLKRIWKNEYQKLPHKNTLNALVQFIDYKDWYDFVCLNTEQQSTKAPKPKKKLKLPKIPFSVVITASVAAVILLFIFILDSEPAVSYSDTSFSSRKAVSTGVPNTVVFDYDISMYDFDSAFIQQSWDRRRRARIEKDEHHATSVYYFPGYHHAKLIINDQIVKEDQVYITTDNWLSMVRNKKNELIPVYINENCISDGKIHVSPQQLTEKKIDLETNDYHVSYHYANENIWCDSDNFSLETAIKNDMDEGGITCQNCKIYLLGTMGMHMLSFGDKGCIGNLNQILGDKYISGKKNDLSNFGADFNEWQKVSLDIKNKIATISLANEEIYKTSYENGIGKLIGITFAFDGCGSIDYVTLKNENNEVFFTETFD